mmetsp:Transcript_34354/g.81423  ORF Transcript_34354/g.81423 Transcript_34354/m.81423 type:complete len:130 (-) Transcript_34354:692-1081(-)
MKRPRRDLPLGIIGSLGAVTVMYVAASLVVTGLVPASSLDPQAPMSAAFLTRGMPATSRVVAIGSIFSLMGTALCSLLGQPRILFRMAKDGLIPSSFASIDPKSQVWVPPVLRCPNPGVQLFVFTAAFW